MLRFPDAVGAVASWSRRGWTVAILSCLTATGILHADRAPERAREADAVAPTPLPAPAPAPAAGAAPALDATPSATALGRVLGDFDLDAKADISIYHAPSGLWFVRRSSDGASFSVGYGGFDPPYVPVAGDFDGDKMADIAVYVDGLWYVRNSSDGLTTLIGLGGPGGAYAPVPADYDGDGKTDAAVYHRASGLWYVRNSATGTITSLGYGGPSYIPAAADYDGDAKADLSVYHQPSGLWYVRSSLTGTSTGTGYGGSGYTPLPADYDGDGKADLVVYYAPLGRWVIRSSSTGTNTLISYGGPEYTAVRPADYDGDGKADLVTYQAVTGLWLIRNSSTGNTTSLSYGGPGYVPATDDWASAPAINSVGSAAFAVGSPGSFTVTTLGVPTAQIVASGVALPAGVNFSDNGDGTGTLSGTPAAGTGGAYALRFQARNSVSSSAIQEFTLSVAEAPVITSGNAVTFTAGAPGSFTVTASGYPAPSLTLGGSLPGGVSFVDNGNGTGTLSGTPAAGSGGTYAITFTATNAAGSTPPQSFTLTVEEAPTITSANTVTFTVGTAGDFTVTTTGSPTATIAQGGATLPSGVTFTDNGDGTGTLGGTPAAGTGGVYAITFTATNTAGSSAAQSFTLNVHQAPAITSGASVTFTAGTPGTFTVTTTGFPAPSIARGGAGLPAGVTFADNGDGTGILGGTPGAGTGGVYAITFSASNAAGSSPDQAFTLTVNEAPTISSANSATFAVGTPGTFTVTTTGYPTSSIAQGGASLPSGVTFTDNGDGTGTLGGTPGAGTGGIYAITFTATNAAGSSPAQSFTLTVNQAPAITSPSSVTFAPGKSGQTFTVTTTGFPTNASMVITQTGTRPSGVTFTNNDDGTATIAGTPAAGTQDSSPYLWTITANNGVSPEATQDPFTFNVTCPVITVSGPPSLALTYEIAMATATFTQSGGNGTITWSATGLPTGVTINGANGEVTGTPTQVGTFSPVITATDAGTCTGTASPTLTVAPRVVDDSYSSLVDNTEAVVINGQTAPPATPYVALTGTIIANDRPVGGVSAVPGSFGTAAGGAVTIAPDGTFKYTPPERPFVPALTGDSFSYTVTAGGVESAPGQVVLGLANRVWYVKNDSAGSSGQSQQPFNTLFAAQNRSTAGDIIFVYRGTGGTTNMDAGIVLKAGQTLIGQGDNLVVNSHLLVAATANPLITNLGGAGITLSEGNTVTGLTVSNPSGAGITGSGVNALSVTSSASVTVTAGAGFVLSGGNGTVSFAAPISGGRAVDIQNRSGGTVSVSGAITGSGGGDGIYLANNPSTTVSFSGGLNIAVTGSGRAFTALHAGTVNVTGGPNILSTGAGPALTLLNVDIGSSNMTFRSISANGATNGISLTNTGTQGNLVVTGDGGVSNNGSGGTIQATTAEGVLLSGTRNVSLSYLNITNSGTDGIRITNVNGFTLHRSNISDAVGTAPADKAIDVGDFTTGTAVNGSITLTNNVIGPAAGSSSPHDSLAVGIGSGTSSWNVTGNTFRNTGNAGINLELRGSAVVSAFDVIGCTFAGAGFATSARGVFANNLDDSVLALTIQNSIFTDNNIHIDLNQQNDTDPVGGSTYRILNNTTMTGARSHAINVFAAAGTFGGTLTGTVQGNVIGSGAVVGSGSATGNGIRVNVNGGSDGTLKLDNNLIRQTPGGRGIEIIGRNGTGGLDVTVTNNNVDPQATSNPLAAIFVQSNCLTTCNTVRSDIRLNTVPSGTGVGEVVDAYLVLVESGASTSELVDTTAPISGTCASELAGMNNGSTGVSGTCTLIPGPIAQAP
jgi:hypothetical protein